MLQPIAIVSAYFVLFVVSIVGMLWWRKRQLRRKLPFGDQMLLLRGPGETQLKLVREFEEDMFGTMMWVSFIPVLAVGACLLITARLPAQIRWAGLIAAVIVLIGTFLAATRWFSSRVVESGSRYLGYFGERLVAEYLEPLKLQGWRIFHDVPAVRNGHPFNIDHVAVGPAGVFAIETKTFKKGLGESDHKVSFDGQNLTWPWGVDDDGLSQAEGNAVWLAERIKAETGERVHVTPYLTLPGWWVDSKPSRDTRLCRVLNPKALPKFIATGTRVLEQQQIDIIADRLDSRCRDVKY